MDSCNYKGVNTCEEEHQRSKHNTGSWTPFLRQLFVNSGVWTIYFALGLCFGAPTVLIPQLRREANSTDAVSEETASWLLSIHGYSAVPWIFVVPALTNYFGRKIPFMIVCGTTLLGFIIFYMTTNPLIILLSEVIQGMLLASNITLLVPIAIEYSSPENRGTFMAIKSSIFFWGVMAANVIGTFWHWKNIGILAFVCIIYSGTCVFWPESPYWLATRGRYQECVNSFRWLRDISVQSEKELENLVASQKDLLTVSDSNSKSKFDKSRIFETIADEGFYKPLLLSICVMSLYHFSGKFVCVMYSIDLIRQITSSETSAYIGMLIMEAVTILGMLFGCLLSKYLYRRTLFLGSSCVGILFLFVISLYAYLSELGVINENKYVSITLLTLFSISISCGVMILDSSMFGEITSIRYKSSSLLIVALYSECIMATLLKIAPLVFKLLDFHGAFFYYGVSASIFTFILYKYLPETKDKTLQEIETYFKNDSLPNNIGNALILHECP